MPRNLTDHFVGEINCQDESSTIYLQVMGTIVFVAVWPFIVLDMKWFPLGRPAAALTGALLMVVFTICGQLDVYSIQGELGNMQTIFLLVGMMILSYYYDREGLLRLVSLWMFGDNKPFKTILWKVCLLSAIMSALVTNDATCLVLTPLLLLEFQKQGRDRRELLPLTLGIATCANIGSAATIFGNPQNAFIASAAGVSLLEFFIALLPAALIGTAVNILLLYVCFYKRVFGKFEPNSEDSENQAICDGNVRNYTIPGTLAEERESVALSYDQSQDPYISSQIAREREQMYGKDRIADSNDGQRLRRSRSRSRHGYGRGTSPYPKSKSGTSQLKVPGGSQGVPEIRVEGEEPATPIGNGTGKGVAHSSESRPLVDDGSQDSMEEIVHVKSLRERNWRERLFVIWLFLITVVLVLLLAIPPPPTLPIQFNLGLVPMGAAISTMLADTIINKKYAYDAMLKIDWCVILMFMGLFVWLAGFQNTCFPQIIFYKLAPYMNINRFEGVLLFTVFVIVGSNILSNVPLVILFAYQIKDLCGDEECQGPLGGLLIAWVSTIAGNFTLIGSVANLIVAEKARSTADYRLSFWNYMKFGSISTTIILFGMLPIVYFLAKVAELI